MISLYSRNIKDHIDHLFQVFVILLKQNIKLNSAKCKFFETELTFLGLMFDKRGARPTKEYIDEIRALKKPRNRKELEKILGKINRIHNFTPFITK